jgi:hypothetical protein
MQGPNPLGPILTSVLKLGSNISKVYYRQNGIGNRRGCKGIHPALSEVVATAAAAAAATNDS